MIKSLAAKIPLSVIRDPELPLTIRLYRLTCATTAVICLLIILPLNLGQHLPFLVNAANVLLGCFSLACLWASWRGNHHLTIYYIVLIGSICSIWNLNAGSQGSITFYFFPALLYPIAMFRGSKRWILVGSTVLALALLLALEYWIPSLSVPFPSPRDRVLDLESGVISSCLAAAAFGWIVLENHDREQAKLRRLAGNLAVSEQNYREIFNASNEALFIHDEAGKIMELNERGCAMFRLERTDVLTRSINDYSLGTSPYSQTEAAQWIARALSEGPQVFNWQSRRNDGSLFWSEIALRACAIGGNRRVIASVRDISDRREAEEALRRNEARLRLAMEAARSGWFEMDLQTGSAVVSAQYALLIGQDPSHFAPTLAEWLEAIHPEDRAATQECLSRCITSGDTYSAEYRRKGPSGSWLWIHSIGRVVEYDTNGKPRRLCGTHTDITKHRELEALILYNQRLETVSTLAGGVAHDLNNIFTPMLMASSVLRNSIVDPQDRRMMGMIETGAKRGATIVAELMAFSRALPQNRVRLEPGPLLQEVVRRMRAEAPVNLEIVDHVALDLWSINANPAQLQQVLLSLCTNARESMPHGGTLTLRIANIRLPTEAAIGKDSIMSRGKTGPNVVFTVTDTGRGILPANLPRIFDPFFSTKAPHEGAGLGLSSAYGLVKGHGGHIEVDSQPGEGSTFRVYLPALDSGA